MSEVVASELIDYLCECGSLEGPASEWRVTRLPGGVSSETYLLESSAACMVVKCALSKLLVERQWVAKPEGAMTEAALLALLHGLTPEHTPALIDADPQSNTIVISAAPADWVNWK